LLLGGFGPGIDVRGYLGHQRLIAQHRPQCRRAGVVAGAGLCHRGQPRPPRVGRGGVGLVPAFLGCRGVWGRRSRAGERDARWGQLTVGPGWLRAARGGGGVVGRGGVGRVCQWGITCFGSGSRCLVRWSARVCGVYGWV
jgi:hypothetical protein